MPTFEERLISLELIKETLISDKKFYMSIKKWSEVTVINRSLKQVEDRIASVRFHARIAA